MAVLGEFAVGQTIEITIKATDELDALVDATDVTCKVMHPDGVTVDTYTKSGGAITRVSVGTYTLTFVPATSGKWKVRSTTTNPDTASPDDDLLVTPTKFP